MIEMIKKFVVGIFALCIIYSLDAQEIKRANCILLSKAVETEIFQKHFYVCSSQETVSIIDTSMYFQQCELPEVCGIRISLKEKVTDPMVNKKDIVIYKVDSIRHIYNLYFYRPHTGTSLALKFRYKKNRIKLLSYKLGAF